MVIERFEVHFREIFLVKRGSDLKKVHHSGSDEWMNWKSFFKLAENRAVKSLWVGSHRYVWILWTSTLLWVKSHLKSVFFREKFTNFDLELEGVAENYSTVGQRLCIMFLRIWSYNFLFVKSLMGLPFKWFFFHRKNKLRCGSEPWKISKSKIASIRLKIFLIDFYRTSEFSWVKTPMGLQRFQVQVWANFSCFWENLKVLPKYL